MAVPQKPTREFTKHPTLFSKQIKPTFFFHSCVQAFLKPTGWTSTSTVSINLAVVLSPTSVTRAVTNRPLEEALAAFTCAYSVVFPSRLVATNCTFSFLFGFRLRYFDFYWREIHTSGHLVELFRIRISGLRLHTVRLPVLLWRILKMSLVFELFSSSKQ
jgi:hypothetical protein